MKLFTIKNIGKTFFWTSFLLGNICLFGFIFTKNESFAVAGLYLLYLASAVNITVILFLIVYGMIYRNHFENCKKAILIMLLNIPIAFLYAWIGISLTGGF